MLRNNVVEKVLKLLNRREKWLVVAAVRFLRTCIGLKDDFYNRYLVRCLFSSLAERSVGKLSAAVGTLGPGSHTGLCSGTPAAIGPHGAFIQAPIEVGKKRPAKACRFPMQMCPEDEPCKVVGRRVDLLFYSSNRAAFLVYLTIPHFSSIKWQVRACAAQVRNNLFEPVLATFLANGERYNLLNSAVLEMVEYVRKENIKPLISHLVEQFGGRLAGCDYVDTFRNLKLKYEQNQVRAHACMQGQGLLIPHLLISTHPGQGLQWGPSRNVCEVQK